MKRLFLVSICLVANSCAMQPAAAPARDNSVVVQLKVRDKKNVERIVTFTLQQTRQLRFFAQFLPESSRTQPSPDPVFDPLVEYWQKSNDPALLNAAETVQRAAQQSLDACNNRAVKFCEELAKGFALPFVAPWNTYEILELVRQATDTVIDESTAHTFVRGLSGDQACLVYPALGYFGFDGTLLAVIGNDIAQQLLNDAQFFVQSLASVKGDEAHRLSPCALSTLVVESPYIEEKLGALPIDQNIPGKFVAAAKNGAYVCVRNADGALSVYDTQSMKQIGDPVPCAAPIVHAEFSFDGRVLCLYCAPHGAQASITIYNVQTMQRIGDPISGVLAWLSPSGQRLVVAVEPFTAELYHIQDMRTLQRVGELSVRGRYVEHGFDTETVEFGFDERLIAVKIYNGYRVQINYYDTRDMSFVGQPLFEGTPLHNGFILNRREVVQNLIINNLRREGASVVTCSTSSDDTVGWGHWFDRNINKDCIKIFRNGIPCFRSFVPGSVAGLSPNAMLIWVAHAGKIMVYRVPDMQPISDTGVPGDVAGFSLDGQLLWVRRDQEINVYEAQTLRCIGSKPVFGSDAGFCPDGQMLWVYSCDERCRESRKFYRLSDMQQVGGAMPVGEIKFSSNGRFLAVGDEHLRPGVTTVYVAATLRKVFGFSESCEFFETAVNGVVAIGQRADGVHVLTSPTIGAHKLASLAVQYRENAPEEIARKLDKKAAWWWAMVVDAPETLQKLVKARFPKGGDKCCVQ